MTPGAGFAQRLRPLMAAAVVGPMAIAFNVSAAGIIYQGPLIAFLDRAIALMLIAAMTMGALSTILFSYRGTIAQPQNMIAVILSIPAAGIAAAAGPASEATFATVAALVAVTALTTARSPGSSGGGGSCSWRGSFRFRCWRGSSRPPATCWSWAGSAWRSAGRSTFAGSASSSSRAIRGAGCPGRRPPSPSRA